MAKNPNSKSKPVKRDNFMNGATIFFLAGCAAEFFLILIRRYYINGYWEQMLAWHEYLKVFAWIGLGITALGAVLSGLWNKDRCKRVIGWAIAAAGVFLGLSSLFIRSHYSSAVTLLSVLVPVAMILCVLWALYDRECSLSLTVLCLSLVVLWVCRRKLPDLALGNYVRIAAVIYVLLLAALAWLIQQKKLNFLLPASADSLPVYAACGLSAAAVVISLLFSSAIFYIMWALALTVFALAVYYTVKLL